MSTGNWAINVLNWFVHLTIIMPFIHFLGVLYGLSGHWQFSLDKAIEETIKITPARLTHEFAKSPEWEGPT